jgi:uncharacterized protein
MNRLIIVRVLKHDGTEYRRWSGQLAQREGPLIILHAEFDVGVSHHLLGEIKRGTKTIEYYWLDRWYNVFRFVEADGTTRLWYSNINTPPILDSGVLSYIDLDIDVLVQPDGSYQVLDSDEFEANAKVYGYSDEEKVRVRAAVEELTSMIKKREFPFLPESSFVSSLVNTL